MPLFVLCDPEFKDNVWCDKKLAGIRDEAQRRRTPIRVFSDLAALESAAAKLDNSTSVIVLYDAISYIQSAAEVFLRLSVHPILCNIECDLRLPFPHSRVSYDADAAERAAVSYLRAAGKTRLCAVGINPDSQSDLGRAQAMLRYAPAESCRILYASGDMRDCFAEFLTVRSETDAVLCPNDHLAICLVEYLKENGAYSPDLFLISHGDTVTARLYGDGITSLTTGHYACGKAAAETHFNRLKFGWSSASVLLPSILRVRGSTGNIPLCGQAVRPLDVSPAVRPALTFLPTDGIGRIDRLLTACDLTDLKIIYGILCGYTYERIGEFCFLSTEAAKYRVRKIRAALPGKNKEEAAAHLRAYVDRARLLCAIEELEGEYGRYRS